MSIMQLSPAPVFRSWDNLGFPLVGGKLFTYQAGTNTPQATYTDSTGTTPNPNPVILNFRGEAFVWLNPLLSYKYVLQDAFGNLIWTEDNIQGAIGVASNITPSITNTFTLGTPTITFANGYFGANGAAVFDPVSGNIGYYARTVAEIAASVVPVNYVYPTLDIRRYGGLGNGSTDDHIAVQAAFNVAGKAGGVVIFPPGYNFLCSSDITVPVAQSFAGPLASAQGPGWATPCITFGTGTTFGFIILGTGATTGGTTSTNYNYAGTFRDMNIAVTGTGGNAFYCNSVNQPRIQNCWIQGTNTNQCAIYMLNCLVPDVENVLVGGFGSATHGSVEFDSCTTTIYKNNRISGGVGTVGGLLIDRCTNFDGDGISVESVGLPIQVGSKTETVINCTTVRLKNLELENPGNGNPYIDIGSRLSGSALVLDLKIDGFFGSPSGTTSIPNAVQMRNFVGIEIGGCHFTLAGTPTSCFNILNGNSNGLTIRPNRNLSSLGVPWVYYVGAQVLSAGPYMEWQLGVLQGIGGRPTCTSRGLDALYDGANLTGATPSILINPGVTTMGGFFASKAISQSGATVVTSLAGGEPGMEITLVAADGNTTLTFGNSGGAFRFNGNGGTTIGANSTLVAGRAYHFKNDGSNGANGGSCWVQL
jgi:hypothetical protein